MKFNEWYDILIRLDGTLFLLILFAVLNLFTFAVYSFKKQKISLQKANKHYRFLILITTYDIDKDVHKSLRSFYNQNFPENDYDIAVIARKISQYDRATFEDSPVMLIQTLKKKHDRGRTLKYALKQMDSDYDVILVMGAGNTVEADFLQEINKAYYFGATAIQTHLVLKEIKSGVAILRALREEINNAIFRRGHVNLGLSSGLAGTGMAFNYHWFRQNIGKIKKGEMTKQLERLLLRQSLFIDYLENVRTYDEPEKSHTGSFRYLHRWSSFRSISPFKLMGDLPRALFAGNFDYCEKLVQWLLPSPYFLLFLICAFATGLTIFNWVLAIKWYGLQWQFS